MNRRIYVGIDPGKSGGIARLHGDSIRTWKYPLVTHELWEIISELRLEIEHFGGEVIVEELKAVMPRGPRSQKCDKCGATSTVWGPLQTGSTMAVLHRTLGVVEGMLIAAKLPVRFVPPKVWQQLFTLTGNFKTTTVKKNAHKERVMQLFPKVSVTHAVADAILLAAFGQRTDPHGRPAPF